MEPGCGEDGPLVAGEAGGEGPVGDNYVQTCEGVPHDVDCNQDIRGMENESLRRTRWKRNICGIKGKYTTRILPLSMSMPDMHWR